MGEAAHGDFLKLKSSAIFYKFFLYISLVKIWGRNKGEVRAKMTSVLKMWLLYLKTRTQMLHKCSVSNTYVCSTVAHTHTHNTTHKIPQTQNRWTNEQADDYEELLGILGIVRD